MSKPIVASRVAGIQGIIQDKYDALLVNPANLEEWINAINFILDPTYLRNELTKTHTRPLETSIGSIWQTILT